MFITILEVLMDQTRTKIMTLKCYLAFIKINNLSNFQKSERLIARTLRNSTRHYSNLKNKLIEIYFQNIRTPDFNQSPTNYFGRKNYTGHDHEKPLKVIPLFLGWKQFCRAGNSLKTHINVKQQVSRTPPTSTLGPQTMETLIKLIYTQVN